MSGKTVGSLSYQSSRDEEHTRNPVTVCLGEHGCASKGMMMHNLNR